MANKHDAQRQFDGSPADMRAALRYALRRVPRQDVNWSDRTITFRVPMSWRSWGEKVRICLEDNGNATVSSKSVWQLYDWGKNKRNVQAILDWMEEYFELERWRKDPRNH